MKQNKSLFLTALSAMALLVGSTLQAAESTCPVCDRPTEIIVEPTCVETPVCVDYACLTMVDHPLYPEARPHLFSVGADFFTAKAPCGVLSNQNRWIFMPGARLSYEYLRPNMVYLGLNGEIGWFQRDAHERVVEKPSLLEARLGYNFSYSGNLGYALVSPYVAAGIASSKARFGTTSHVRVSYVALGLRTRYAQCADWSIGLDAKVIRTLSVNLHTVKATEALSNRYFKRMNVLALDNAWTGEVALPITYYMGAEKQWSLEVAPAVTGLTLSKARPAYGVRTTLGYRF